MDNKSEMETLVRDECELDGWGCKAEKTGRAHAYNVEERGIMLHCCMRGRLLVVELPVSGLFLVNGYNTLKSDIFIGLGHNKAFGNSFMG